MACTPLPTDNGSFLTASPWEATATKTFDGKTVTLTTAGPNPGLSVVKSGGGNLFHAQLNNHSIRYAVLGNKWLAILDVETTSPSTRTVTVVNFDTMTELVILTVLAPSTTANPVLNPSPAGSMFLAYGQNGTSHTSVAIYRSDNGAVLCALGGPITPTGQTTGAASATTLTIHYTTSSGSTDHTCPRPVGRCQITPANQSFGSVAIGGCPVTPPSRQFTIRNNGSDCLTVQPIAGSGPYTVTATSKALPAVLAVNEQMTVTVAFNPTAVGTFNASLAVVTAPANGDSQLVCQGSGIAASFATGFSAGSVGFGAVPVGETRTLTLTITNSGSRAQTVGSSGVTADGFSVNPFSTPLGCGQSTSVQVRFTPASEGPHQATLLIDHQAAGSPRSIQLAGSGCVANALINPPPASPISFGDIEQGYRTVRVIRVANTGDGPLDFRADISGADAALFGLPDPGGSTVNPPLGRTYHVDPVVPCGSIPAGPGEIYLPVSFIASDPPGVATATLTISGHNATNFPASQTWHYPLSATITPPTALDIALVIDRSGSMNDPLGSRVKLDAAISASELFVELLRPDLDDRVALVRFSHERNVIQAITPVTTTGAPTQAAIRNRIGTDVPPASGATAIAGGTMLGVHEVETPHPGNPSPLTQAVVVVTDGIENTAFEEPAGTWLSLRGGTMWKPDLSDDVDTAPVSWPSQIKRYAIGVGRTNEINSEDLQALAEDANRIFRVDQDLTGLRYFQLEKYYTAIFMDVVGMQSIADPMYWIAAGDKHEIEFEILPGDVDAMVVIYDFEGARLPFFCVSPSGEIVDPVSVPSGYQLRSGFSSQTRLVHFKMPPLEPDRYAGTWRVVVLHEGRVCFGEPGHDAKEPGFLPRECREGVTDPLLYGVAIGAGSNFRLQPYITPGPVWVGEPILLTGVLAEAGLPVTGGTVTVESVDPNGVSRTSTLVDDGFHQDGAAEDGEYADVFTQTNVPGIYHFTYRATANSHGQQVVREAVRDKEVYPGRHGETPVVGQPGGGKPGDGTRPPGDRSDGGGGADGCCDELTQAIREQSTMLKRVLDPRSSRGTK